MKIKLTRPEVEELQEFQYWFDKKAFHGLGIREETKPTIRGLISWAIFSMRDCLDPFDDQHKDLFTVTGGSVIEFIKATRRSGEWDELPEDLEAVLVEEVARDRANEISGLKAEVKELKKKIRQWEELDADGLDESGYTGEDETDPPGGDD